MWGIKDKNVTKKAFHLDLSNKYDMYVIPSIALAPGMEFVISNMSSISSFVIQLYLSTQYDLIIENRALPPPKLKIEIFINNQINFQNVHS